MILCNLLTVLYTLRGESLAWLISLNMALGCVTSILMWCVQCSDPGIISRDQDEKDLTCLVEQREAVLQNGSFVMNFRD